MTTGKVIIFSAPSGSGKTTIVKELLKQFPSLEFSISATSRAPRGEEQNGRDYYFMSSDEFASRADNGEFVEWEEVYSGIRYGTLRTEIARIWDKEHTVVFDVDVVGGMNLKKLFGDQALALFIMPPSLEELRRRLETRATDSPEAISYRLGKAEKEISHAPNFDTIIVNDNLSEAISKATAAIGTFLSND